LNNNNTCFTIYETIDVDFNEGFVTSSKPLGRNGKANSIFKKKNVCQCM